MKSSSIQASFALRRLFSAVGLPVLALGTLLAATSLRAETAAPAAVLPEVDHWVYLSELPDPAELSKSAAANGLTVQRIDRTADSVVITYKYADGLVSTMGYKLLSAAGSERVVVREQPVVERVIEKRTTTVIEDRDPEIIYVDRTPRTRVVYRDYRDDFWLPLTVGLGVGYIAGHNNHHHYRPHYSSHWRSHRHFGGHSGHHRGHHGHRGGHHGHRGRR